MKKMNVAVLVGHNSVATGCSCPHLEKWGTEWEFNKELANELSNISKTNNEVRYTIFKRNPKLKGYKRQMNDVLKRMKMVNMDFDIAIELHLNSVTSEQANGAETIRKYGNEKLKMFSSLWKEMLSSKFNIDTRYDITPTEKDSGRGYYGVLCNDIDHILLEPFFASSPNDCEKFENVCGKDSLVEYARLLHDVIVEYKGKYAEVKANKEEEIEDAREDLPILSRIPLPAFGEDVMKETSAYDEIEEGMLDAVNSPNHYNGEHECFDVMIQQFGLECTMAYAKLNGFKYVFRCQKKENEIQDLKKALWYLENYISMKETGKRKK